MKGMLFLGLVVLLMLFVWFKFIGPKVMEEDKKDKETSGFSQP